MLQDIFSIELFCIFCGSQFLREHH